MENNDPAKKQLVLNSLIEFSQLITSKLDLNYILNNILLSVMGKMLISKGVVLLKTEGTDNIYKVKAAKGINLSLIDTFIEAKFPKLSVFSFNEIPENDVFVNEHKFEYYFKIYFQNKYLGILCLGKKLNTSDLSNNDIIFIETMLNISASAIENTIKFEEVSNLNNSLNNKVRQLNSLFELGKEFNSSFIDKENIIKLLNFSLLGNFGIKDFVILSRDNKDKFVIVKDNKNLEIEKFDLYNLLSGDDIPKILKKTIVINEDSTIPFIKYLFEKDFELFIPTIINNKIDSIICLGKKLNKKPFSEEDIEFLESIMNLSLISIHNYFLFQEYLSKQKIDSELIIAREIQEALLPDKIPEIENYEIAGMNNPALQIGGDYFDFIKISEDKLVIVIADVSGKGTPASLLMASIQSAVHSYLKLYEEGNFDFAKVTEKINELIYENTSSEKFITFSGFVIDGSNDEPLPGAYVINDRAGRGVFTNSKGYFILDVFPGDSILFSYLGFRKQYHIIPKNVGLDYSAVVELSIDAKMLKEVKVYPFRTEEEFKTAFLEMELPNEKEREILEKNYSSENIKRMAANQAMSSVGNYRYAMDQQLMHLQGQKQVTQNPLTNIFAWSNFIKSVKNGSLTDKSWKKGSYIPTEKGTRDNIFKGSN